MKLDEEKKSERREKKKATVRFCFSMIDGRGEVWVVEIVDESTVARGRIQWG